MEEGEGRTQNVEEEWKLILNDNCDRSDVLPYLQANKLAFATLPRNQQKICDSCVKEEKQCTCSSCQGISIFTHALRAVWPFHDGKAVKWHLVMPWVATGKKPASVRAAEPFTMGSKQHCFPGEETVSFSSKVISEMVFGLLGCPSNWRLLTAQASLKMWSELNTNQYYPIR